MKNNMSIRVKIFLSSLLLADKPTTIFTSNVRELSHKNARIVHFFACFLLKKHLYNIIFLIFFKFLIKKSPLFFGNFLLKFNFLFIMGTSNKIQSKYPKNRFHQTIKPAHLQVGVHT